MTSHSVAGGGGTRLHVVETGNPQGQPILFIHGFSQCGLCWSRQLQSDLAQQHRLVTMDLRGHGLSDKPRDAYADSRLWADDVDAVLQSLRLEQAIMVGWSFGPLVILDYIRHYGEHAIGGVNFVGGISKLGSEAALSVLTPEFLANVPGLLSADADESVRALDALIDLAMGSDLSPQEHNQMLGWNVRVPPYVRQALFARAFDNDDLRPRSANRYCSHTAARRRSSDLWQWTNTSRPCPMPRCIDDGGWTRPVLGSGMGPQPAAA